MPIKILVEYQLKKHILACRVFPKPRKTIKMFSVLCAAVHLSHLTYSFQHCYLTDSNY